MLLKHHEDQASFLNLDNELAQIASGPNAISTTKDSGNFINGPVSFSSPHTSMRFGGVFRFNPLTATCIPSTIATPIPTFELDIPIKNVSVLTGIVGIIASLI
jgi:hypothetical protein